jgi:transketolase
MRAAFVHTTQRLLAEDPRVAVVLADISAAEFSPAARDHPDRVLNVGIREQLMLSVAGGLALTGLRPYVHSYAPFLVDRAYEQIKLDLDHQGVGAVLVSIGGSYDASTAGRTHQSPQDVALIDTLNGDWTVHVPGHPEEVPALLRAAAAHDDPVYVRLSTEQNASPHLDGEVLRSGDRGTVLAVGPMLDPVLEATADLDVTVVYTHTPRPFAVPDTDTLVLVEPYLAGTSSRLVDDALAGRPHRLLALGVDRTELRRYGSPADHARWRGLDPDSLRHRIGGFIARSSASSSTRPPASSPARRAA